MKKDFVSSEVKKSINDNGYRPERLGGIIRKAIGTLIEKIRKFKLPEKPVPVFDFAAYNEMVKTNNALRKITVEIETIDKKNAHKHNKINECQESRYQNFRVTLIKEIADLQLLKEGKQNELDRIVKKAGYKNVSKFMTAFEKSALRPCPSVICPSSSTCSRILKAQHSGEKLPTEKESVLSKLKSYQAEAKTAARKDPEKQKKKETDRIFIV